MNSFLLLTCLLVTGPIDDWEWTTIDSAQGKFKASFPSVPVESNDVIKTDLGEIQYHQLMSETANGQIAMGVSFNDYPEQILNQPAKDLLDGGRDGAVKNLNGKLIAELEISLSGNPGREFTVQGGEGESRLFYHTRVYLVGTRMYQLQVIRIGDTPLDAEAVVKFFSSFELTN